MPILPGYEPRTGTIPAKVEYELAIVYQLKKVIYFAEQFTSHQLEDRHINDLEDKTYFYFDSMIGSIATLAEYYFSNVIYSVIGTILDQPLAPHFAGFINGDYESKKKSVFERYELGLVTKGTKDFKDNYALQCNNTFDETLKFILDGKYDVVFDINNYIKHNNKAKGSFIKALALNPNDIQRYHYIYFTPENSFMLKGCEIKYLVAADEKLNPVDGGTLEVNNIKYEFIHRIGSLNYIKKNDGTIFVKCNSFAGITTSSLTKLSYNLCLDVINVLLKYNKDYISMTKELIFLKEKIEHNIQCIPEFN